MIAIGHPRRYRRPTAVVSGAVAIALALVGCSSGSSGRADTSAATKPVTGGSLTFATYQEPECLDPHQTGQAATSVVIRPVVDSLVYLDPAGAITPWLAQSWTVSPDQLQYTFKLRSGVKFSDGTPFNAAAVKANLDHIVDPATKSLGAGGILSPYYRSTSVVDDQTAVVSLKTPYASFLSRLSAADFGIESPASLATGPTALCGKVVGTGPFIMDSAWNKGQGVAYHRNPDYQWAPDGASHQGPAYLDTLQVKLITQDSVRVGALTSHQVDVIGRVPAISVKSVQQAGSLQIDKGFSPGLNYSYFPNTNSGIFADTRVRQAFRDGIDWNTLVEKLFFGVYSAAEGPLSPSTRFVAPTADTAVAYDSKKADQLLDQAGWSGRDAAGYRTRNGERLTVRWTVVQSVSPPENITLAEQVQAEAKKLGIDVQIVNLAVSEVISNSESGNYDLKDTGYSGLDADVLSNMFSSRNVAVPGKMGSNIARYTNATVDRDLAAAQETTDDKARAQLYQTVQQQIVKDAAVFPVYSSGSLLGSAKAVHGLVFDAEATPLFYGAWRS